MALIGNAVILSPRGRRAGRGRPATPENFRAAAEAELADARPLRDNGFKIDLARRTIVAVLGELTAGELTLGELTGGLA